MENPFKNFTTKDWLYVGGAVASIAALYFVLGGGKVSIPSGTQTDVNNPAGAADGTPNYMNYNTGSVDSSPIPLPGGADMSPDPEKCCCNDGGNCAQASALATGNTFGGVDALINYYQNTNPVYVQLQKTMLKQYAAYFATGESYSKGGIPLGVAATG